MFRSAKRNVTIFPSTAYIHCKTPGYSLGTPRISAEILSHSDLRKDVDRCIMPMRFLITPGLAVTAGFGFVHRAHIKTTVAFNAIIWENTNVKRENFNLRITNYKLQKNNTKGFYVINTRSTHIKNSLLSRMTLIAQSIVNYIKLMQENTNQRKLKETIMFVNNFL